MEAQIKKLLENTLPKGTFIHINRRKNFFGGEYLQIAFAASDVNINNVQGQKPQIVSLSLEFDNMELITQVFGGNGGQHVYLKPDPNHPREKYLAMTSRKLPFRKPKPEEPNIMAAIKRFAENWIKALKENRDRLMYQDLVNYDQLLAS